MFFIRDKRKLKLNDKGKDSKDYKVLDVISAALER